MKITTSYNVWIKHQVVQKKAEGGEPETVMLQVDNRLMRHTADTCLAALKLCTDIFLKEWDFLSGIPVAAKPGALSRKRAGDILVHTTRANKAKYPGFDERFPGMPSYTRRAVVAKAMGMVSSYVSNHANWEKQPMDTRGREPSMGMPDRYELAFYDQERDLCDLEEGIIGLKLYNGKTWGWYYFQVTKSDAKYIANLKAKRKMLSPVVEKVHGKYRIRFSFEEHRGLVSDGNPLSYVALAVDLGINAPASWSVMTADGTVHAKGVIHLGCEEDRLRHLINRKRMLQQAGKKPKAIFRMANAANRELSIRTCRKLMEVAVRYSVDVIVFEHLDKAGKKSGKAYRERLHLWRANDVQERVGLQAHRHGMRISRVCAWGTSKLAFDGSGAVTRGKDAGLDTYSLCRFRTGKVCNCDLSASMNIGARYFLREYAKREGCPDMPKTPQRTYATLREVAGTMAA